MARTEEEIEKVLAEHAEQSKGVALDIQGTEASYQQGSQIKSPEIPWWAIAHLHAYGIEIKPQAANPTEEKSK